MGDAPVQVTRYSTEWPGRFAEQRDQLETILQPWLFCPVEHVGSTAVPGLAAKPIIDIAAPIRSLVEARSAIPVLKRAGWLYWPSDPNGSWRLWFLRPQPENRTHHLYLVQHDDPHLRELTAFRDRLRRDALARQTYAELKQQLAQQYRTDRDGYTAAKTHFVADLLQQSDIEMQPRPEAGRNVAPAATTSGPGLAETGNDRVSFRLETRQFRSPTLLSGAGVRVIWHARLDRWGT